MATMYPTREIQFSELGNEPFDRTGPILYVILKDGVRFEFLVKCDRSSDRAVVFGTGTVTDDRSQWPVFSRRIWMSEIPCSCIYYFDPTLYHGELRLAWCYGTNERWYLSEIGEIVRLMLDKLCVRLENVLMMGSSGGGFTSLILATMLRCRCQAINPQIDFRKYNYHILEKVKETVLKPGEDWVEQRVNALAYMRSVGYIPQMHIIQNILEQNDIDNQIIPFIEGLNRMQPRIGYDRIRLDFYHHLEGHNGMPLKSVNLKYILQDLEAVVTEGKEISLTSEFSVTARDVTIRVHPKQESESNEIWEYAYYLYKENQLVDKTLYSSSEEQTFKALAPGRYRVKFYVKSQEERKRFVIEDIVIL